MASGSSVLTAALDPRFFYLTFSESSLAALGEGGPGSWASWWSDMRAEFAQVDAGAHRVRWGVAPANDSVQLVTFGPEVRDACEEILGSYGEFLPVQTPQGRYWAFHCLHEVSAIDEERSRRLRWVEDASVPGGRRLLFAAGMAFKADVVQRARVFALPERPGRSRVFFSAEVVDELRRATCGFMGTDFCIPYG